MTPISKLPFKVLRKLYNIVEPERSNYGRNWKLFPNKEYASSLIQNALNDDKPVMIARLGSNELVCMANYLGVKYPDVFGRKLSYIKNQTPPWWWDQATIEPLQTVAGFFPGTVDKLEQFSQLMIKELSNVDILGSWRKEEVFFSEHLNKAKKVMLEDLEPFFTKDPWTMALKGKKVLVVHPFVQSISSQYSIKDQLFDNPVLPDFELLTVKAVQTAAGENSGFNDWFEALEYMKEQIATKDFDVCILGCGAYGFPLASYVKNMGKKAIHLGGVSQMLFGIKGRRWENYIVYPYQNLYNDYWIRPAATEKPAKAESMEGACYW